MWRVRSKIEEAVGPVHTWGQGLGDDSYFAQSNSHEHIEKHLIGPIEEKSVGFSKAYSAI